MGPKFLATPLSDPLICNSTFLKYLQLLLLQKYGTIMASLATPSRITRKTRKQSCCPVFGAPRKVSDALLPTYEDVMKHYLLERIHLKPSHDAKEPTVGDISENLATVVESIWRKASIPIISHTRVLQMIRTYHDKYRKLLKSFKGRKNNDVIKLSSWLSETKASKSCLTLQVAMCRRYV